jgi:hypothetical protein
MAVVTITRFEIATVNAEESRARHAALVSAIRSAVPGLAEAGLGKPDDETWVGIWRCRSAGNIQMDLSTPARPAFRTGRPTCFLRPTTYGSAADAN